MTPGSRARFNRRAASCLIIRFHRGIHIVHPPQVEHHRWAPPDLQPRPHGLTPLDASTRALLRQMRWRKAPHDRRLLWLAFAVALLLHACFIVVVWREMRPPLIVSVVRVQLDQAIQVRFIAPSQPAVAPPPPALASPPPSRPAPAPRALPRKPEPVAKDAMTIQLPPTKPAAAAHLFDENGQPLLPAASSAPPAPTPGYVQHLPTGDSRIMQHDNPINYQATRFDGDWARGSAIDRGLQKLVDKTTVKKTVRLPGGVRVHCAVFLLFGGCSGEAPSPPSAKDGDERLSMAPAKPLAANPHPPVPPTVEACIAMYRDGKPLAWGCPIDTPKQAIDDELRQRAAGSHAHP
ncbi:MAG: hypothetical protein ABI870_05470 [Rhodanobacter sp.]